MKVTAAVVMFVAVAALGQTADVAVLDRSGSPVTGLTRADFELKEDGVRRDITTFSAAQPHRVVALVIDNREIDDALARNQVLQALEQTLQDDTTWCVLTIGQSLAVETAVPCTADRAAIRAGLESIRSGSSTAVATTAEAFNPRDDFECGTAECVSREYQIDQRTGAFYAAAFEAARRAAPVPGSRSVLIITKRVPIYEGKGIDEVLVRRIANAGARLFLLRPPGAAAGGTSPYWFTERTGGLYLTSNRVEKSLEDFTNATKDVYQIGFATDAPDNKYHHIKVRVTKSGRFTVLHRDGYQRRP